MTSTTSPLAIATICHFYAICEPFPNADAPAQREIITHWLQRGLIESTPWGYRTTDKGDAVVEHLKAAMWSAQQCN